MNEKTFWAEYDTWQATKGKDAPLPLWKQYEGEASRHDAERRRLDGLLTDGRKEARELGINTIISNVFSSGCAAAGAVIASHASTEHPTTLVETGFLIGLAALSAGYACTFYRQYRESKKALEPIEQERKIVLERFTDALAKQGLYKRTDALKP